VALLTLADAKDQLNITTTAHDTEMQKYVDAAIAKVEEYVGPVDIRSFTERVPAPPYGAPVIALQQTPAVALTSVVPVLTGGHSYAVASLDLDGDTGLVQRLDGGRLRGPLRVTYTAGRTAVPPHYHLAARILVQHLWSTQRGPGRPALGGQDDYSVTEPVRGFGYAVPNRVLELLGPLPPRAG